MKYIVLIGAIACAYNTVSAFQRREFDAGMGWLTATLFAIGNFAHYVT